MGIALDLEVRTGSLFRVTCIRLLGKVFDHILNLVQVERVAGNHNGGITRVKVVSLVMRMLKRLEFVFYHNSNLFTL